MKLTKKKINNIEELNLRGNQSEVTSDFEYPF